MEKGIVNRMLRWAPALLLVAGNVLVAGVSAQRAMELRAPLAELVPRRIASLSSQEVALPDWEREAVGVSDYLLRSYGAADLSAKATAGAAGALVYIGYYDRQTQGKTIHSPRNCLPGAGWEPLASRTATIATAAGSVEVNRYLLQRGEERALVLYWYQGRGRVEANEYAVKWHLLRDAALRGRTEEALVRVVVPVSGTEEEALRLAATFAGALIPDLDRALPD